MQFDRKKIYKLPWSKSDNPGAWVEVTDICNLNCPGCFRHTLEGHRKLEEVKREILEVANLTNCSRIAISGGEPLIYPHIVETVSFISSNGFKPIILTNGVNLTRDLALELEKAGLYQFYFHVDSGQNRPDWMDKSESELNELRQHFADLTHKLKHVRCGFNITISRKNIEFIPEIVNWYRMNISKVQHLSLIAQRGIPLLEGYDYYVNGKILNLKQLPNAKSNINEINISTEEMYSILYEHCDAIFPAAYLSGTAKTETYKFLIIMNIGTKNKIYGEVGPKTIELYQYIHHLFKKSYSAVIPKVNKTIFVKFIVEGIKNPLNIFQRIHVQQLVLQQPFEIIEGETNLCDGCVNLMLYRGNLINSCRLDEYRLLGGPLTMNKQNNR
jgi:hypothetical protein